MNATLIAYYVNLLIIQYHNLPKARAHIEALVDSSMIYDLAQAVVGAYSIDTAAGSQLDVLGKYIGLDRRVLGAPFTDTEYRDLLRLKILKNNGTGSLAEIDVIVAAVFDVPFILWDTQEMALVYVFATADENSITDALTLGLLPSPAGVGVVFGLTPDTGNVFGYRTYGAPGAAYIQGYGSYADPGTGGWLFYG